MGSGITLSNGNLSFSSVTPRQAVRATHGKSSGKWYWEVKLDSGATPNVIGVSNKSFPHSYSDSSPYWRSLYAALGNKFPENVTYGTAWVVGDIIGVALDLDDGTLEFYKNGVSMGISHTNVKELGEVYPTIATMNTNAKTITFNFGEKPFAYNIPPEFNAYNIGLSHKILISSEDEYYSVVPEVMGTETTIPQMISNTAPRGRAFASSEQGSYYAYRAFNSVSATSFVTINGSGGIGYLGYEFVNHVKIGKYVIQVDTANSTTTSTAPKDWTFEGSNDGVNWNELDTQVNQIWAVSEKNREYAIDIGKIRAYTMYRLNWTDNNGYLYTTIQLLQLYEYTLGKLITLPNQSEQTFINHGMDKDTSIDLTTSKILERRYIVQDNAELGSGRVFKQKIDTTKIPIKNVIIE